MKTIRFLGGTLVLIVFLSACNIIDNQPVEPMRNAGKWLDKINFDELDPMHTGPYGVCTKGYDLQGDEKNSNLLYYPSSVDNCVMTAGHEYPLVIFLHGSGLSAGNYPNLLKHIASQGYIVASLGWKTSEFEKNGTDETQVLNTLNKHLNYLYNDNNSLAKPYLKNEVHLTGHSRGGGAAYATAGNISEKLKNEGRVLKSVISLAPSLRNKDVTAEYTIPCPYLVLYGAQDGDVSGSKTPEGLRMTGFLLYEKAVKSSNNFPRSMIYFEEVNHCDFSNKSELGCETNNERREILAGYVNAFIKLSGGKIGYAPFFEKGKRLPSASSEIKYTYQYASASPVITLADFENENAKTETNTGGQVWANALEYSVDWAYKYKFPGHSYHTTKMFTLRWDQSKQNDEPSVDFSFNSTKNIQAAKYLTFRAGRYKNNAYNNPDQSVNFTVGVKYKTDDKWWKPALSSETEVTKHDDVPYSFFQLAAEKGHVGSIRIPLSAFKGVDWSRVQSVYFKFNKTSKGAMHMDDIKFE